MNDHETSEEEELDAEPVSPKDLPKAPDDDDLPADGEVDPSTTGA